MTKEQHNLAQRLYDLVAKHLLTQNACSMQVIDGGTACAYRGADGMRCAVGALFPNDAYLPSLEFTTVAQIVYTNESLLPLEKRDAVLHCRKWLVEEYGPEIRSHAVASVLSRLQQMHDRIEPEQWPTALLVIADDYELTPFVMEKAL